MGGDRGSIVEGIAGGSGTSTSVIFVGRYVVWSAHSKFEKAKSGRLNMSLQSDQPYEAAKPLHVFNPRSKFFSNFSLDLYKFGIVFEFAPCSEISQDGQHHREDQRVGTKFNLCCQAHEEYRIEDEMARTQSGGSFHLL